MRATRALEAGPSDCQHLLGIGHEDSEWGRRTFQGVLPEDISAANILVSAAPPCKEDTRGHLPDLTNGFMP